MCDTIYTRYCCIAQIAHLDIPPVGPLGQSGGDELVQLEPLNQRVHNPLDDNRCVLRDGITPVEKVSVRRDRGDLHGQWLRRDHVADLRQEVERPRSGEGGGTVVEG